MEAALWASATKVCEPAIDTGFLRHVGSPKCLSLDDVFAVVSDIREGRLCPEDAEPYPYLVRPAGLFDSFRGIGTDCVDAFYAFVLAACASRHWNTALKEKFGTEKMVRNISKCVRALADAKQILCNTEIDNLPAVLHPHFYANACTVLDIGLFDVKTKPPAVCTRNQLASLMGLLRHCLDNTAGQSQLATRIKSYCTKHLCHIAAEYMIMSPPMLPLASSREAKTCQEYAQVYRAAQTCLGIAGKPAWASLQRVAAKLESGYGYEVYDKSLVFPDALLQEDLAGDPYTPFATVVGACKGNYAP